MELREGYKETEIGVIPEDWDVQGLLSAVRIASGQVDPKAAPFDEMPLIAPDHIESGTGRLLEIRTARQQNAISGKYVFSAGDVVYSKIRPYLRKAILASFDGLCSADMYPLRPESGVSGRYILENLLAHRFTKYAESVSVRSGMPKINRIELADFRIPLPKPAEQKAIAEALSDVDASIAALSRLIAKKRDLRQGAMQQLLGGQTRLPGFTAPWQERRLGDHLAFLKNGVQSRAQLTLDDPVRYLHYGDIHLSTDLCLDLSNDDMPRLPSPAAAGLARLQDGDIVFVDASEDLNGVGKSLEIVGAIGVEAVSGQHTIAARFDKSLLADGFKRYLQFIPAFTTHLRRLAAGTKVYATNRKHIASAELKLPEADEQIAIARVLSDMGLEISALETRLDKIRALKQAMMQALLAGRVRLPVRRDAVPQSKEAEHA